MDKCPKCGSERIERDTEKGSQYEQCMDCGKRVWIVGEKNTKDTDLWPWQLLGEKEGKSINGNTLSKEVFFPFNSNTDNTIPSFPLHGFIKRIQKFKSIIGMGITIESPKVSTTILYYSFSFHFISFHLHWKRRLGNIGNTFGGLLFGAV